MLISRPPTVRRAALGLVLAACLPLWWTAGCAREAGPSLPLVRVELAGKTVVAEVPSTALERYLGLGGRSSLSPGRGMLFFFYRGSPQAMCMRAMNFPLDFIWLARGRVAEVTPRVPPGGAELIITPAHPVDLVLEVPAGWAQEQGVRPGQRVAITPLGIDFPPELRQRLHMEPSHDPR
jgi:uncharacterized membrane protein (UPF0127 family)